MVFEHGNKNRTIFERKTSIYDKIFNWYKTVWYDLDFPFEYLEYVMLDSVRSTVKFLPNEVFNILKKWSGSIVI